MSTSQTHLLISNTMLNKANKGSLEMADPRTVAGNIQDEPGAESKMHKKPTKSKNKSPYNDRGYIRRTQELAEEIAKAKADKH